MTSGGALKYVVNCMKLAVDVKKANSNEFDSKGYVNNNKKMKVWHKIELLYYQSRDFCVVKLHFTLHLSKN